MRPGVAAQEPAESRPERVVAHLGQAFQLVEQLFDGRDHGRPLLVLEGGDRV